MSSVTNVRPQHTPTNSHQTRGRVLLAEDAVDLRTILADRLRLAGYDVTECRDGSELVTALTEYFADTPPVLASRHFDLIISDIRMPGISGLSVAEATHDCLEFPPTILITAFGDEETHEMAREMGVVAVFDKPFDMEKLLEKVREVITD